MQDPSEEVWPGYVRFPVEKVKNVAWDSTVAHKQVDAAGRSQVSEL